MIEFQDVKKIYEPNDVVLDNVTLTIKKGEFVSLVGLSGAGKSTLMRLLTHELRPTSGSIIIDGINLDEINDKEVPYFRRKFGTIYQDFKLLAQKTAFENVAFAMDVSDAKEAEIARDVPQILTIVGLADKANNFPSQLSGGAQ